MPTRSPASSAPNSAGKAGVRWWLAGLLAVAGLAAQDTAGRFVVVPGESFGPIRESTTRTALTQAFGAKSVTDGEVQTGEGQCTPGTWVFAGSPDVIEIAWRDAERTRVAYVQTRAAGARWATRRGVRVGATLRQLERLAGHPLTFNGFGWDYGGGMLWGERSKPLRLYLAVDSNQPAHLLASPEITGDREVRSDHPIVRQLRIRVHLMIQSWGAPFQEAPCRSL